MSALRSASRNSGERALEKNSNSQTTKDRSGKSGKARGPVPAPVMTGAREILVRTWSQFAERVTSKNLAGDKWYFRGGLPDWSLETSIERAFKDWNLPLRDAARTELLLLRDFKRAYRLSADNQPPQTDDTLGWLALMQHHGAPTRLLDWTYSPFVAAYFAMEALLSNRQTDRA